MRLEPLELIEPSRTLIEIPRQPKPRLEICPSRRERLLGIGWVFEWPGGQRPLNSTWPWSGVKLSILVLWGPSTATTVQGSNTLSIPSIHESEELSTTRHYFINYYQQTGSVIKQELHDNDPYDNDPFIFGQYQGNHLQLHSQRPSDSNRSSTFDPHLNSSVNQAPAIFQPIPKLNYLGYNNIQAAAPRTNQVLLTMSHISDIEDIQVIQDRQDRQSKSPAPPQGSSYKNEGIADTNETNNINNINNSTRASHNLNTNHDTIGVVPEVSNLQSNIITVGPPNLLAEGRECKNHTNENNGGGVSEGLLSVAGIPRTSPHNFSAQGKHQIEASQVQGYQQLHYRQANNQPQNDQAGLYERGNHLSYDYSTATSSSPDPDRLYLLQDYEPGPDPNFFQNYDPPRLDNNMSLSYESRAFMPDTQYPMQMAHESQEQDEFKTHDEPHYPSPPPPMSENPYTAQPMTATPEQHTLELPELPKDEGEVPSPGRSKPVPKPDREVTKDANGRFYCTWPGCTEEVKDFNRKCEWSKHMDKHDRPYRCKETGCEKLPGFTYSGGLLRHEREVHGKHGGPKKQLNCPHPNCKRHTGKGFSRQENLNEHLRRVHTDTGMTQMTMEETEEDVSQAVITGMKRKRGNSKEETSELETLREEFKKIKAENDELKRNSQAQQAQTAEVMRQLVELQNIATLQHPRMNAPQANM
ncbi:hypothetical protein SBOR_5838 [Sclerotinia borealis F-4128]|uniref:C2H2-type domain-containing protein n=1 Tax=Sclerotinia borealis (strain F-4128) TaxID=1432307 RepID=W9CAI6_SCLBF|nr:hypothetical protein SBOR_5838 [Sclerotinia borealis F-4128]